MPLKTTYITDEVGEAIFRTGGLQERYERAQRMYELEKHKRPKDMTDNKGNPLHPYTTNQPRVFANKLLNMLGESILVVRSPYLDATPEMRDQGRMVEQLFQGFLATADRQRMMEGMLGIHEDIAFHGAVRGVIAGVHMLVTDKDGRTYPIIKPWDPVESYWRFRDNKLAWMCRVVYRNRASLDQLPYLTANYPIVEQQRQRTVRPHSHRRL